MHIAMPRERPKIPQVQCNVYLPADLMDRLHSAVEKTGGVTQKTLVAVAIDRLLQLKDDALFRALSQYQKSRRSIDAGEEDESAHSAQEPRSPAERGSRLSPRRA